MYSMYSMCAAVPMFKSDLFVKGQQKKTMLVIFCTFSKHAKWMYIYISSVSRLHAKSNYKKQQCFSVLKSKSLNKLSMPISTFENKFCFRKTIFFFLSPSDSAVVFCDVVFLWIFYYKLADSHNIFVYFKITVCL